MRKQNANRKVMTAILAALATSLPALAADWYWFGGCGNGWGNVCYGGFCGGEKDRFWNNWGQTSCTPDLPALPGPGDDVHFSGAQSVWNAGPGKVHCVFLEYGVELSVEDGGDLTVYGTLIRNHGELWLRYGGHVGYGSLTIPGDVTLSGYGALGSTGGTINGAGTLHVSATQTVRGYALNIHVALDHAGTLSAEPGSPGIALDDAAKANSGLMQAVSGAYLDVYTQITQTGGGRLRADGGAVRLFDGSAVVGGALDTANDGRIYCDGLQSCFLQDVTNEGWLGAGNGGRFIVRGTLTNDGRVTLYYGGGAGAGHMQLDGNVHLGGTGVLALEVGDITSANGGELFNGAGHTLTGTGPVVVNLTNGGTVSPGNGTGTLAINANYTQSVGGTLEIEVQSTGTYDRLAVAGTVVLDGGTLRIRPVGGFVPQPGQQFVVLTAGALSGQFSEVAGPGRYMADYAGNEVTVTVLNGPGDLNCDGKVDFQDIDPFVLALADPAGYEAAFPNCDIRTGDCNGDGSVDFGDIDPFVALLGG